MKGITTLSINSITTNLSTLSIALFPFMKGITTFPNFLNPWRVILKLHYFRLWRELRLGLIFSKNTFGYFSNCTISVYEGNYDRGKVLSFPAQGIIALFPFMKGITTLIASILWLSLMLFNDCTISVYEGNYD